MITLCDLMLKNKAEITKESKEFIFKLVKYEYKTAAI